MKLNAYKNFKLSKLYYAMHYVNLIPWLGTTDNFNTKYTEHLHIDFAKQAYKATNYKDELVQMTAWLERKEKILQHNSYVQWRLAGKPSVMKTNYLLVRFLCMQITSGEIVKLIAYMVTSK